MSQTSDQHVCSSILEEYLYTIVYPFSSVDFWGKNVANFDF